MTAPRSSLREPCTPSNLPSQRQALSPASCAFDKPMAVDCVPMQATYSYLSVATLPLRESCLQLCTAQPCLKCV